MYRIINPHTDPAFNLASEQYLLDCKIGGGIFMLWRNEPSVIIGRNQNAYAELDLAYCETHGIKVVRRLTGGGAVFHDLGNLNYSFICDAESDSTLNFARFCAPVIDALRSLGLNAGLSGRNDIIADGKKVSGSAQCVRNGRMLHHGTLLYSADLSLAAGSLKPDTVKLASKGIKSVSSRVANIKDLAKLDMSVTDFAAYIAQKIGGESLLLGQTSENIINRVSLDRYSRWDWNFGQSKSFENKVNRRFPFGTVEINYTLDHGIITALSINGDFFGQNDISELESLLIGVKFNHDSLLNALYPIPSYINGCTPDMIYEMLIGGVRGNEGNEGTRGTGGRVLS